MGSKNGTGTIAVNSNQILNTKAKLDKAFLNENAKPSVWVDDSSLEIMNSTYSSFKEATENISAAIVGFNQYLDSMATAFEKKDTELAFDIQDLQIKNSFSQKRYDKNSAYNDSKYRSLPGAE
ncbi:hypothetical protein PNU95_06660 [Streptococcus parasanguinis]|uniref:TIGR04197 family type VII secretion effector n=1 Tax=Streptococcus gingivalis TaxID=3111861 RepID=A0ABU6B9L1_9STRE|nr:MULTISPECIES: hypothetical protein [Streptococcus]MDB8628020.1 hypothetical protein [Streptococcus parasanguinis]MEB3520099.1 hypothetical protein [Streptococcus sp. S2(2023)]